ncbi:MAG TPA: hypothetical protein VGF67_11095 [Ktedonobacteraceae bacterium]|jgi:hypothetical protein
MSPFLKRLQNGVIGTLLHREILRENLPDVSFIGGVIIFLFFTSKDSWLASINLPDLRSDLTVGDIITFWNLLVVTLPLTIGIGIIILTVSKLWEASPIYVYFEAPLILSASLLVSVVLVSGSIPGNTVRSLLFAHPVISVVFLLQHFWSVYRVRTFLLATLLSCYAAWALCIKLNPFASNWFRYYGD